MSSRSFEVWGSRSMKRRTGAGGNTHHWASNDVIISKSFENLNQWVLQCIILRKKIGIYEHDKLRQIACCRKVPQIGHATIFRTFITKYWDVRLLPNNSMRYACVKMWLILLWFVMYLYIYASATSLWINKPMRCSQDPFFGRRIMNIIGISSPSLFSHTT